MLRRLMGRFPLKSGGGLALESGVDAFASLTRGPLTLVEAIERAPVLLAHASETQMRAIQVGVSLRFRAHRRFTESSAPARTGPLTPVLVGPSASSLRGMWPMAFSSPVRE